MEAASGVELRLAASLGALAFMIAWESVAPLRRWKGSRLRRGAGNLALGAFNALIVRFVLGGAAVATAAIASSRGWGALSLLDGAPWAEALAAVVALDLAIYVQHVVTHAVPLLWRLHRVHHTDLDVDATTGVRFHPIEILLSGAYKCAVVAASGAPPEAVVAFEAILNAASLFNHGNVRMAPALERALRLVVVTPDMHRVHHSEIRAETDSNFGFSVSIWDRLFGTYCATPKGEQRTMPLGVRGFTDPRRLTPWRLLVQPLARPLEREPNGDAAR